jgi:hypothetical protein
MKATEIDQIKQIALLARMLLRADARTERMVRPKVGDLVVEMSWGPFDPDSVGVLLEIQGAPELPDRYVIEPLSKPGTQQGWQNAQFIAVPTSMKWPEEEA